MAQAAEIRRQARSWASSAAVRSSMQANRPRDTVPELRLRSLLHRAGLRFRKHRRPVPGLRCEVDVLFPLARVAVFLDGCFWHGCPSHATWPATNAAWWARKLARTKVRDELNTAALQAAGWHVVRVWEHEDLEQAARRVARLVRRFAAAAQDHGERLRVANG